MAQLTQDRQGLCSAFRLPVGDMIPSVLKGDGTFAHYFVSHLDDIFCRSKTLSGGGSC